MYLKHDSHPRSVAANFTSLAGARSKVDLWQARRVADQSSWTSGHSERVTATIIKIGREMELSEREIDILHAVGLLHDLGKIGISLEVWDKPGISTPEEPTHQEHLLIGVRILNPIPGFEEFLPVTSLISRSHRILIYSFFPTA